MRLRMLLLLCAEHSLSERWYFYGCELLAKHLLGDCEAFHDLI